MQIIEPGVQVMVLTGYTDIQMQYQGFEATVVTADGDHIKVRDHQGRIHECDRHELTLLDPNYAH